MSIFTENFNVFAKRFYFFEKVVGINVYNRNMKVKKQTFFGLSMVCITVACFCNTVYRSRHDNKAFIKAFANFGVILQVFFTYIAFDKYCFNVILHFY